MQKRGVILSADSARRLVIKVVTVPIVSDSQSRSDLLEIMRAPGV